MDWIGVEWGAEPRAWAMEGKRAKAEAAIDLTAGEAAPQALLRLVAPWLGDRPVPVIAAGLAGATAAVPLPCPPLAPPFATDAPDPRMRLYLIPGLRQDRPATDLTKGAELRMAGFAALHPDRDGILCLPGPAQTVWAHLSAGEVISLQSFLTPRLLLAVGNAGATPSESFTESLEEGRGRPERLAARLAQIEAAGTLGLMDRAEADDRRAGLWIGAELAAARAWWLGQPVTLAGPAPLTALYEAALNAQGVAPATADPEVLSLAGLVAAHGRIA
ncbi:2-dehydro-3-deoxygalactonokinase [Halodurantibacterium flavum]|uniref:2-dehydro-3-deoxygalactonokinase n=1 Tax=Halodurantibacterium flavum TaxID=1382802 RepID=A0ABW4S5K9_9RHOB